MTLNAVVELMSGNSNFNDHLRSFNFLLQVQALQFIKQLGEAMHSVNLESNKQKRFELVYVIGPSYSDTLQPHDFGPEDLRHLGDIVDGFSLMTYDFSLPQNPGPNAPLMWIRSTLRFLLGSNNKDGGLTEKIFVGLNFYGNDFDLSGGIMHLYIYINMNSSSLKISCLINDILLVTFSLLCALGYQRWVVDQF